VSDQLTRELVTYLAQARDLEALDRQLLDAGVRQAKDARVRDVYVTHLRETEEHLRAIDARLRAYAAEPDDVPGRGVVGALELRLGAKTSQTPTQLAISAFGFEGLEIAVYHLLSRLAERCADEQTATVVQDILAEEERAAELLAETLDRALTASIELDARANARTSAR
jgi:ferritin-like metal-binding protein YciE